MQNLQYDVKVEEEDDRVMAAGLFLILNLQKLPIDLVVAIIPSSGELDCLRSEKRCKLKLQYFPYEPVLAQYTLRLRNICVVYQDHQDRRVGNDLVNNFYNQMVAGGCVCGSMQFARACQLNTHLLC